jgi:glyoxylase-like metal-dependent hydrolase (beta-lactamase superfamily II)
MMRVHHLNCGSMRPLGGKFIDGDPGYLRRGHLICHCLLIESEQGLILVDTGIGTDDIRNPKGSLTAPFRLAAQPILNIEETAIRQITKLGLDPADVRHILPTHLDQDHAGGFRDFPKAKVHIYAEELRNAMGQFTARDRARFRKAQFGHADFESYETEGDDWFGFDSVRNLKGLPEDIRIVPLAGHTKGHAGIAVNTGEKWLLHCGDAYFYHGEVTQAAYCTPGLVQFQKLVETERAPRLANQERLRTLVRDHGAEVEVFSAHSATELARYQ